LVLTWMLGLKRRASVMLWDWGLGLKMLGLGVRVRGCWGWGARLRCRVRAVGIRLLGPWLWLRGTAGLSCGAAVAKLGSRVLGLGLCFLGCGFGAVVARLCCWIVMPGLLL